MRLKEYVEMGAELRRIASLESVGEVRAPAWDKTGRTTQNWWQKGWETMRIPRFAFALLVVAVLVLGSSLTIVKVRAHEQGRVLILTAKPPDGTTLRCALSLEDKNYGSCAYTFPGQSIYKFRVISTDGARVQLSVGAKVSSAHPGPGSYTTSVDEISKVPEALYWFGPGEKLKIDIPGSGTMLVVGEVLDRMPVSLRFDGPVLLRGKEVLADFGNMSALSTEEGYGIELYAPHDGRYEISLSPLEGAVEGQIEGTRVSFELNGQPYEFVTGGPVAPGAPAPPGQRIWILHLPNDKPSYTAWDEADEHGFIAVVDMTQYLPKTPPKN